ncbi:MAG: hypothetical protein RJA98_3363, partial [Pseudomonadota bacterium]
GISIKGNAGAAGTNGTKLSAGAAAPTASVPASPAAGDMYIKTGSSPVLYTFASGAWDTGVALGGSAAASGLNVELRVTKTAAQTLAATDTTVAQTTSGEAVVYSTTNDAHAALTGGNTWDGTTFTVGGTGAGWYQLTSQFMVCNTTSNFANQNVSMLMEINGDAALSIYGTTTANLGNVALPKYSIRSVASGLVYLSAGDAVQIKAKGNSGSATLAIRTDGSSYFSVIKLN